jgi:SAM-dependent methyltransferase
MTPPPSFDRLAPIYELLERISYGPLLHRCRTVHLHRLLESRRALILGDGDGRFLADFLQANPQVVVDSADLSGAMLAKARRRAARIPGAIQRVRFVQGDARALALPQAAYDLVVTNFFLDCFEADELQLLVDRLAAAAAPGALWLDGDFRLPAAGWMRAAARLILAVMYLFFAIATRLRSRRLTDAAPFLAANGFRLAVESRWLGGFLSSRLWVREASERFAMKSVQR